jgi:catechol 2,3-dioxygenase-like lactoylglutathione lyase family enzyme
MDFPKSFKFYHETLKMPVLYGDVHGPYAEFGEAGGMSVSIFQRELMHHVLESEGNVSNPTDEVVLIFKAEGSVDSDSTTISASAPRLIGPTDRADWGVRTAHFRDPEGLLVEVNKGFDE